MNKSGCVGECVELVLETEQRVLSIKDICQEKMLMHARSQVRMSDFFNTGISKLALCRMFQELLP